MSLGQRGGSPTAINLSFLDSSHYFFFQVFLIYAQKAELIPL
jgi:hypothetical protein